MNIRHLCRLSALTLVIAVGGLTTAQAQTDAAQLNQRVQDLEKQLSDLRSEIAALKTSTPAPEAKTSAMPAMSSEAPKADPLAGINSVLGGATVTGLVDAYYQFNSNQPVDRTSGLRLFDNANNQFMLNMIELGLVKTPDASSRLGYNVTFGFGNAMKIVNSGEPSGVQDYLKEGYFSYLAPVGKGLQVDVGKFVTPNGAEVIESNANWNYSRSLLFDYAIPFYHFGVRGKYAFNDKLALTGYVVNGWNNIVGNFGGKTGGLSATWNATKKLAITENWMGGPGAVAIDNGEWRNLSDTVITYSPTSKLTFMVNGDYGRVENAVASNKPAEWWGTAGYIKYQFNPKYAVATRYEYYNDPDGFTLPGVPTADGYVPTPGHAQEFTGTFERKIASHLTSRLEYRYDAANKPMFISHSSDTSKHQNTFAVGLVYALEKE